MAIDPYAPCPCGSGKKLKFCCSDLVSEIQKIEKLISGEQPHAALRFIEQLLEKQPERASLLDLRASLELSLEQFDAARETIQRYLGLHPDNPSAYGQAAVMAAAKGETAAAVGALQAALERLDGDMPQRVYEAVGAVGHALLIAGDLVAARGHLVLYAGISPEDDNRGIELLLRMNLQGGLPLMLRESLPLADPPETAGPWQAAFDEANHLARRGLWQRAEAEHVNLLERSARAPEVIYNLALVRGWLGDSLQFAAGMREFARLDVPWDDAVEAEALAQLVDPPADEPRFDVEQCVYQVSDADVIAERFLADRRAEHFPTDPEDEHEELGKPRDSFVILDRPAASTGVDLGMDDVPNVLAFVSLYGKRTDRQPCLTFTADRDGRFGKAEQHLTEIAGDALGELVDAETIDTKRMSESAMSWRWRLPDDTPLDHRRELLDQRRQQAVLQDWPAAPNGALAGASPQEAAGNAELKLPLAATVLITEQAAGDLAEAQHFRQLRDQLQIPAVDPIDPAAVDLARLPLVRIARLQLDAATDPQLETLLNRAAMAGANLAMLAIATELVTRERDDQTVEGDGSSEAGPDLAAAYRQLIRVEPDPAKASTWAARAKQWANRVGQDAAEWAVLDLELQLERRNPEGIKAALHYLEKHHIGDSGVAEAVYRLLYSYGLGPALEHGQEPAVPESAPAPAAAGAGIWTPGSESPSAEGEERPVIWTP